MLVERFWEEYRGRFGEPELPMPDLGAELIGIQLESNDIVEYFDIKGEGWSLNRYKQGSGLYRVKTILNELDKYNIKGMIVRQKW